MNNKLLPIIVVALITFGICVGVYAAQLSSDPETIVKPTDPPTVGDEFSSNDASQTMLNVAYAGIKVSDDAPYEGLIRYVFKLWVKNGTIAYDAPGFDQALAPLVSAYGLAPADHDNTTLMHVATQEKFEVCSYNLIALSNDKIDNLTVDLQKILSQFIK
jgi:hypothetical protein